MIPRSTLTQIGLSAGEAKVYLALLKLGQSSVTKIVKEAKVAMSKSYEILDRLEGKGLVSHVYIKKTKHFSAAPPEQILRLLERRKKELEEKEALAKKLIPQLTKYQKQIQGRHQTEIYYGLAGLETVFYEQLRRLRKGEYSYVIGITQGREYPKATKAFFEELQRKRDLKGVKTKLLFAKEARKTLDVTEDSKFTEIRYLPYAGSVSINLYNDVTIIGIYVEEPIIIKITSIEVAKNFMGYFKLLWKLAEN